MIDSTDLQDPTGEDWHPAVDEDQEKVEAAPEMTNADLERSLIQMNRTFTMVGQPPESKLGVDNRLAMLAKEVDSGEFLKGHPELQLVARGALLGTSRDPASIRSYYGRSIRPGFVHDESGAGSNSVAEALDKVVTHHIGLITEASRSPKAFEAQRPTFGPRIDVTARGIAELDISDDEKLRAWLFLKGLAVGLAPAVDKAAVLSEVGRALAKKQVITQP